MYEFIINPKTGRKVSIYGKLGKQIITNYFLFGGSSKDTSDLTINQEMTIEDIKSSTLNRDVEICGEIRDGKFLYKSTGTNDGSRGLCSLPNHYNEEWHTHAHNHRFYPSNEDFHKIMKNFTTKSIIFTVFGYWTLECSDQISKDATMKHDKYITHINNWFATQETKDNGFTPKENTNFEKYIHHLNENLFKKSYGINCTISWTPY